MKISDTPDIFLWSNKADAEKNDIKVSLYVFTKSGAVMSLNHSKELTPYLRSVFLYGLINDVQLGAATGLTIRDIHSDSGETENVIDTVTLENVTLAQSVFEQVAYGADQLDAFSHNDHEIKKVAGIIMAGKLKGEKPFFIAKQLQQSKILTGATAWSWTESGLKKDAPEAVVEVPTDNQVLVIGEQIFVFNLAKFTKMFGYDAKKQVILDAKIEEISKQFKLSFPDGLDMRTLAKSNSTLAQSLLRAEPANVSQEQVIDQADKFGLALMTDDAGAIIIMDGRDATMFANLLNDDYVESDMTSKHYLAVKKKEVFDTEDKQLHSGL
jgi:hypothetical protein